MIIRIKKHCLTGLQPQDLIVKASLWIRKAGFNTLLVRLEEILTFRQNSIGHGVPFERTFLCLDANINERLF